MTATVVHVLAERGLLDYDLPIAAVWPEFAQHGKDGVTLRHALTHAAGVPALPAGVTPADLTDWDRMCAIVAASRPLWEPGTTTGYHAWTFGWLVGEVVRRVTGRPVSQVLAEDVAGPLGVADQLFFGVPEARLGGREAEGKPVDEAPAEARSAIESDDGGDDPSDVANIGTAPS